MKRLLIFGLLVCSLFGFISTEKDKISYEESIEVFTYEKTKYVYPLGRVVAIKAETEGVLVIGYESDNYEYVGKIKIGDSILKINDIQIENASEIPKILESIDEDKINVLIKRNGETFYEEILVKIINEEKKLGFWVRDKISGFGTMTFYDFENEEFKGIAHAITDKDTNQIVDVKEGGIYYPNKININKSSDENIGYIESDNDFGELYQVATFDQNDENGITTRSNNFYLENDFKNEISLIEVATKDDVNLGDAYILFEDENQNINSYLVEVTNIDFDDKNNRQISISIKDDKLIEYTGGIVMGMSGSPLIQNNKLIGALNYVSKDNTKNGYCIFIDEMIK
ncbi:MAG: SpoIVB peptidase S55 domain-containing protein [Peptostreptococcaceae bacterium]